MHYRYLLRRCGRGRGVHGKFPLFDFAQLPTVSVSAVPFPFFFAFNSRGFHPFSFPSSSHLESNRVELYAEYVRGLGRQGLLLSCHSFSTVGFNSLFLGTHLVAFSRIPLVSLSRRLTSVPPASRPSKETSFAPRNSANRQFCCRTEPLRVQRRIVSYGPFHDNKTPTVHNGSPPRTDPDALG